MLPTAPRLCPKGDAYARPYRSEAERREAFPQWLHTYNHHRGHTALKGRPHAGRVPNLTGQRLSAGRRPGGGDAEGHDLEVDTAHTESLVCAHHRRPRRRLIPA